MREGADEEVQKGSYWWRLVKLNAAEWPYAVLGSVGSVLAGVINPIFALIISELLRVYYEPDKKKMEREVRKYVLMYVGAGVVTVGIYVLQHYFFGIVGENLTARVRDIMFRGEYTCFACFNTLKPNSNDTIKRMLLERKKYRLSTDIIVCRFSRALVHYLLNLFLLHLENNYICSFRLDYSSVPLLTG